MAEYHELIPYSVVTSVINKLTSLASTGFGQVNGVEEQLKLLLTSLASIKEILPNAKQRDPPVQQWIVSLKDVIHAADDIILDDMVTDTLLLSDRGIFVKVRSFLSYLYLFVSGSRIVREINKIQTDVSDIVKSMDRLNLSQGSESSTAARVNRVTTSLFLGSDIIGREDEKNKIISMLMQSPVRTENVSVVSVFGMGGIGKTTIAQMVFNDEQVMRYFEKRMWVYVSDHFDVKTVVKSILQSLSNGYESRDQESLDDLLKKVERMLDGERYLLVLDDVWNEDRAKWTQLRDCLMRGAQGSKILLTTRNEVVAEVMGASFLFHLKGLNEDNSWDLLRRQMTRNDAMNEAMEYVLRKIATKCNGVPLGINTMAGILRSKHSEGEWINVLEAGFLIHGKEEYDTGLLPVLELSYQHLSPQLKQCFAYFSVFPKGWEIEKNKLIQLWMAQGYLEFSNDVQQMEDVGNQFVHTLLQRSFLTDKKFDEYGNLVSFKMHDLIHDLAIYEAGNDYYLKNKPMHISISLESNIFSLLDSLDANRLRTFFLQRPTDMETSQMNKELSIILSFKRLRVLNLSGSSIKMLSYLIGKLKNLRYLDLSECVKLASLHKSVGNLVNLQTLKLTGCETLQFSTEVITKLVNLRHLEIYRCKAFEEMMPAGLGKLLSLQSLSSFSVADDRQTTKKACGKLNELQNLNNLRGNLQINRLNQVRDMLLESQDVNLKEKKLLPSLALNWENEEKTENSLQLLDNLCPNQNLKGLRVRWYPGDTFSTWISSITSLSHIHLFGFNNCQCLPPLESLPNLKSLEIGSMKAMEYIYFESMSLNAAGGGATFFKSLERLKISGCEKLQGWKMMNEDDSPHDDDLLLPPFLRLSQLIINKCPKLTMLPTFPNVEELELCESWVKPLRETLDTQLSSSSSSTTTNATPLSMLKSLKIQGKVVDIRDFPSWWIQNLTSLEYLEFADVKDLEDWFVNSSSFPCLRKMVVYDCDLNALPDGMGKLVSLEHMKLLGCQNLALLPEGMKELKKLVTLEILDCPLLVERCQRETGLDWPKISHVPNIRLKQNERSFKAHFSWGTA